MTSRVQLALNVNDIDQAVAFYAKGHSDACCGGTAQPGEPAIAHDAPCC